MEPEGSLLCSQQSDTGPYPEPDASSPHYHPLILYDPFQYYPPFYALMTTKRSAPHSNGSRNTSGTGVMFPLDVWVQPASKSRFPTDTRRYLTNHLQQTVNGLDQFCFITAPIFSWMEDVSPCRELIKVATGSTPSHSIHFTHPQTLWYLPYLCLFHAIHFTSFLISLSIPFLFTVWLVSFPPTYPILFYFRCSSSHLSCAVAPLAIFSLLLVCFHLVFNCTLLLFFFSLSSSLCTYPLNFFFYFFLFEFHSYLLSSLWSYLPHPFPLYFLILFPSSSLTFFCLFFTVLFSFYIFQVCWLPC
jgi:hypothetical protein